MTVAVAAPGQWPNIAASSEMLARLHGQFGWTSITSVNFKGSRAEEIPPGQRSTAIAATPGVESYRIME